MKSLLRIHQEVIIVVALVLVVLSVLVVTALTALLLSLKVTLGLIVLLTAALLTELNILKTMKRNIRMSEALQRRGVC